MNMTKPSRAPALLLLFVMGAAADCIAIRGPEVRPDNGSVGSAGTDNTSGQGGSGAVASAPVARPSGLPVPPGSANVPKPVGIPGNLKVLDWAGFKSALTYTLDDGQPSQIEHYGDLQATGVRFTFFVNSTGTWASGFTSTFTRAVRDGHEVGNHTAHHCHADPDGALYATAGSSQRVSCARPSAGADLDECTQFIISTLGAPEVWTSAAPFGDVGYASAASERFFLNRGVQSGTVAANDDTDPFDLPIWGPSENDPVSVFNANIDSSRSSGRWLILLLHSIGPTTARWYATVDVSAITGSIAHARALGDVWIDTMANVGAYWRGQKVVTAAARTASGSTQTWRWTLPPHFPAGKHLRVTVDGGALSQDGKPLAWNPHGYYEIALDAGSLTLAP